MGAACEKPAGSVSVLERGLLCGLCGGQPDRGAEGGDQPPGADGDAERIFAGGSALFL